MLALKIKATTVYKNSIVQLEVHLAMARYDEKKITLTPRYIEALHELLEAELEMMQQQDDNNRACWAWGICTINNLCEQNHLQFEFGDEGSRPKGMKRNTCVRENC